VSATLIEGNTAANGGGLFVSLGSRLTALNSSIVRNRAGIDGAGIYGLSSPISPSYVTLTLGSLVDSNIATRHGGGLMLSGSTFTLESSSIEQNTAGFDRGGLHTIAGSAVTLIDSLVSFNVAGDGGGLFLAGSSTLTFVGSVGIRSNLVQGSGGGILAQSSTVILRSGRLDLSNNEASNNGGGGSLTDASALVELDGQQRTAVSVLANVAGKDGGGLAVSGDSTVNFKGSNVRISNNQAGKRGAGLFVNAALQEATDPCSGIKIVFWQLEVADDKALGDGGGIFSFSSLSLLGTGGYTNMTGNTAMRGGALAMSDSAVQAQSGHTITVRNNAAMTDGGAFALLSGATISLLEARPCPSECTSDNRGSGSCSTECMSAECNWDGGDCGATRFDVAGDAATESCDRNECDLFVQTNAVSSSDGCWHKCFSASCDWSRDLCIEQRGNVESCPLLDAAAYASIRRAQEEQVVGPLFLTGGTSQNDFGRCSSSCLSPAAQPNASAMMGVGMLGAGSLRLVAGNDEWLHASLRDAITAEMEVTTGFTVESWIQMPHSCAAQDSFAFVLASSDYAVAIRGKHLDTSADATLLVYPLFFWTAAPTEQCSAETPLVLITSTGSIGGTALAS